MTEKKRYVYIEMTEEQYQAQSAVLLNLEKVGQRICNADIEKAYEEKIDSLITTIESQKEEIEGLKHRDRVVSLTNETLARYVNEGKEEIGKCRAVIARFNQSTIQLYQGYGEQELTIMVLTNEIESLKAITELAVKGLKRIRMVSESSPVKTYQRMEVIADTTLSEIERRKPIE